ncbi:12577_t:CDS:1, partial [Racocetra persica]
MAKQDINASKGPGKGRDHELDAADAGDMWRSSRILKRRPEY